MRRNFEVVEKEILIVPSYAALFLHFLSYMMEWIFSNKKNLDRLKNTHTHTHTHTHTQMYLHTHAHT